MALVYKQNKKFESVKKIADEAQKKRAIQLEHRLDIIEIVEYADRRIKDEPEKTEEPTDSKRTSGPNG